jgi:hypothetical protein
VQFRWGGAKAPSRQASDGSFHHSSQQFSSDLHSSQHVRWHTSAGTELGGWSNDDPGLVTSCPSLARTGKLGPRVRAPLTPPTPNKRWPSPQQHQALQTNPNFSISPSRNHVQNHTHHPVTPAHTAKMVAQSEAFQKAVVDSKKLTSKPSNEDLLEIYGAPYRGVLRQSTVLTYCPSPL